MCTTAFATNVGWSYFIVSTLTPLRLGAVGGPNALHLTGVISSARSALVLTTLCFTFLCSFLSWLTGAEEAFTASTTTQMQNL